ncbi:MAG TPA: helix-turn-helix domain-containing protein, partial [Burkholderiaceae bacterium]|nr:helix-turn-helix domain-containing protein [Burkholderiaceae bacterium]
MKTEARQRLLQELKSGGPQTAAQLADRLGLSAMGVHKQLQALADEGLLLWQDEAGAVGRPRRVW